MEATLEATVRDSFGKNEARRTRRDGRVPAVVYGATGEGASREATPIAVDPRALLKILHSEAGANTLISLKLSGADARVLIKEYQLDPVTHAVLHADFYRVRMDRTIHLALPRTSPSGSVERMTRVFPTGVSPITASRQSPARVAGPWPC